MNIKFPVCSLIIFSIWTSLFAPLIAAQSPVKLNLTDKNGLQFNISEAVKIEREKELPKPVQIEKLSPAEADAIFRRLPQMQIDKEDTADFRMRSESLKPLRTGNIIPIKFPADETQTAPNLPISNAKNLEVERFSPTGNVSITTDLSITFSQPMIAVTSQTVASENVPVKLSPEVKGKWRWLGTNTLIFDAETRFPMATKFTATIPKGTKSAVGGSVAKDFSFTFTTPPPKIEVFAPKADDAEIYPEYALMAAKFNQEIDEKAILPKISVFADGKRMPIKLITGEINGSYTIVQQLGEVKPKHWLAFRTIDLLPLNAEIKVVFEKSLPSAEGVGISESEQSFSFNTLGLFKLSAFYCGYSQPNPNQCQPSDDFRLQFNRSLYPVKLDTSLIKIEPPIENAQIETDGSHSSIYIKGKKQPNTSYKVTLSGEAIDYYKLKIGSDISAVFNVGVDQPQFFAQGGNFVTLDPQAKPTFSIYSKNQPSLKVKLYAVTPEDILNFGNFLDEDRNNGRNVPTPTFGKLVFDKTIETNSEIDTLTETRIDLSEALPNKFGHVLLIAEPTNRNERYDYYNQPFITWLQSTNIGLDSFADYEKLTAFVTDLQTGKHLGNADISLHYYSDTVSKMTDESGIATFDQSELKLKEFDGSVFLVAKNNADSAILNNSYIDWRNYWQNGTTRWFVFDDRKMYRPNEEVSIKGYLRKVTGGKFTDIAALGTEKKSVNYILRDPRNNEIARGTVQINTFGAFDFKLKLHENINLGYQQLEFWSSGFSGSPEFTHNFQVQEFRRPEFEVSVEAETPAPFFVGTSAVIDAEAKYYTGGFLSNTDVNWSVSAYQTTFSPPNHEDFTFGTFIPWWRNYSIDSTRNYYYSSPAQDFGGTTDANGKHRINLDLVSANPARPYILRATAELQDVNRQTVADTKIFLVHPSDVYVGLRSSKTFVRQGESLGVEAIATDLDGKIVPDAPITINAVLKDWQRTGGSWQEVTIDTQTCQITSANEIVSCNFTAKQGGIFTFSATVLDQKERPNSSEITVWVAGGNTEPKRGVEQESVELIPDKKDYAPGDTAEILVNAPIVPAEGVMTVERNGIIKTERFTINESSTILRIPIEERYLPNIHVKVDLVGIEDRTDDNGVIDKNLPNRPAFAVGELNLNVSKASRKLNVSVEPVEKTIAPGAQTNINIEVKDNLGNSVANSEVAVVAVDESVLALSDYKIQNPLDAFYQQIAANVAHFHSRANVLLTNPNQLLSARQIESLPKSTSFASLLDGSSADMSYKKRSVNQELRNTYKTWINKDVAYIISENAKSEINVRRNFEALAIFSPSVVTDANGKATVNLRLPDNLTRYRIT
ncbi:MAG: MG2 domain-containing protein, partial [Actinomycetota bacterium]